MQVLARYVARWPIALACVALVAAAVLVPGLGASGLWEPQERQLADRVAPRDDLAKKLPEPVLAAPADGCWHQAPKDAAARTLTNRAIVWGRDYIDDSDGGRKLPLAVLGLLTVLAAAGIAMRTAGPRAGIATALVLLSMPLLVLQSRQLTSEIGTPAGGALVLYGLIALGRPRGLVGIVDALVSLVAIAGGIVIGFLAGGALLGVAVPVGAYAAAGGLGVPALGSMARSVGSGTLGVVGKLNARWAVGHSGRLDPIAAAIRVGVLVAIACAFYVVRGFDSRVETFAMAVVALVVGHGVALVVRGAPETRGEAVEQVKALLVTIAAIAVLGWLAYQLYDLREPQPGLVPPQRALLGKAIVPSGCWSSALGAMWRADDDLRYIYDSTFEQIAYGTFPWGVLAPIAFASLLASADERRRRVGALTLAWAGAAWIASEVFQRKVGFTLWAGFPALAIAIGAWLDGLFADRPRELPAGAKLIALFFVLAVLDLGKDLQSFSERLTSLLVGSDAVPYPAMSHLVWLPTRLWVLILGLVVGLGFALTVLGAGDGSRWRAQLARVTTAAMLGGTVVFATFWAYVWQPALAQHLSSKALFDTFQDLRKPGDQLVLMGDLGDAPHDYAPDSKPELVSTRDQIVAALARPNRVFAISPQTELCQLHRELAGKPYYVVDDRNLKTLLLSNKLDGATDKNPLATAILHAEPKAIASRPKGRIVFDGRIELLGWDIPKSVGRGAKFEIKLYFKVLQAVGGAWTVLMHFDGSAGRAGNGDHKPINDRCQTSTWQAGDYIIDTYTVLGVGGAFPSGPYEVWTGFFTGSAPNWKNMPVSEAPGDLRDTADRVKITSITLD